MERQSKKERIVKVRDGENRGRDEERERERETTPSSANPKQPNLRNENPNRCSCGYEQVLGGCLVFTSEPPVPGPCKDIFLIILVLKMRTRFPSVILLTNLDQNLLVVNLQLNLWLTSISSHFFFFFFFFQKHVSQFLFPFWHINRIWSPFHFIYGSWNTNPIWIVKIRPSFDLVLVTNQNLNC